MPADTTKTRTLLTEQSASLFYDPRALRKFWLDAMTQAADGYLRSSTFLELMRDGLKTMIPDRTNQPDRSADSQSPSDFSVEGDSHR
jgi:hypothetical protein